MPASAERPRAMTEIAATIAQLRELQTFRRHYMTSAAGIERRLESLARRAMGWQPDAAGKANTALKARAKALVETLMAGKPALADEAAVTEWLAPMIQIDAPAWRSHCAARAAIEKGMGDLAKTLPVWAWCEDVAGLGPLGLATVIGISGDLTQAPAPDGYLTPRHLWKRLGWAPESAYAAGERGGRMVPRKAKGMVYGDLALPVFFAQSPRIDKATGEIKRAAGPYRDIYDARRRHTAETHPEWRKGSSHQDAMRVMLKQVLADLWRAWQGSGSSLIAVPQVAPATTSPTQSAG